MDIINFKINRKIEFVFEQGEPGISLIQDVGSNYMLVTIPMKGNKRQLLPNGTKIDGIYYEDEHAFLFTVEVVDRVIENIPLYKITLPSTFERIQRRNFVRIPISIPLLYMDHKQEVEERIKDQRIEEIEKSFENRWQDGYAMDLSGGGMKISVKRPIKIGSEIFIILKQKDLYMGVKGKVVRCIPFIFKQHVSYHLGMEFIDISDQKREQIISFIFTKLRELRKKGK